MSWWFTGILKIQSLLVSSDTAAQVAVLERPNERAGGISVTYRGWQQNDSWQKSNHRFLISSTRAGGPAGFLSCGRTNDMLASKYAFWNKTRSLCVLAQGEPLHLLTAGKAVNASPVTAEATC